MTTARIITGAVLAAMVALATMALAADRAEDGGADGRIVITAGQIEAMQAHKMADILNHVPGVVAGDTFVSIHGSYKVKAFVDGRPINDPTSSHGGIKWDLVSPEEVERIEILRGKGSLVYGQDASGGVILVTTKKGRRLRGNLKAYGGNLDTFRTNLNLQASAGIWGLGASGGFETTQGFRTNNDKQRWHAGLKASCRLGRGRTLSASADYLEDRRGLAGLPAHPTPYSRKHTRMASYSFQATGRTLSSKAFCNDGRNHNTDSSRNLDKVLHVVELGEDLTAGLNLSGPGQLACGAGLRWARASGTSFDDKQEHTVSVFAARNLEWTPARLDFNFGLRANFNSDFDDALNPELKVTFKGRGWRLAAAYSRSNNTPSFYQRYNETSSTVPNPDLDMETADNYSLTLSGRPAENFSGRIGLFHNRLSDRITYITDDNGIGRYQNFGLVTYTGGDLSCDWKVLPGLSLKPSYTYLEAIDRQTGLRLPGKARHTARVHCYWQPADSLSVVLTVKYVSRIYRNKSNTRTVPDYTVADLRAEYAFKKVSLFAQVKNLFDRDYFYADGLPAPPLTWLVGINCKI